MKTKKKVFLIILSAVLLVVASVMGTLAYLTSTSETVNNTFSVGKVSIDLNETDVDEYGEPIKDADPVKANEYKMVPAHVYTKDPTVTVNKESEPAFVRVKITVSEYEAVKAVYGANFTFETIANNTINSKWVLTGDPVIDTEKDTITYEYRYNTVVDARTAVQTLDPVFTQIKIPETADETALTTIKDMKISVIAHAIQKDTFADAAAAWTAFDA